MLFIEFHIDLFMFYADNAKPFDIHLQSKISNMFKSCLAILFEIGMQKSDS